MLCILCGNVVGPDEKLFLLQNIIFYGTEVYEYKLTCTVGKPIEVIHTTCLEKAANGKTETVTSICEGEVAESVVERSDALELLMERSNGFS